MKYEIQIMVNGEWITKSFTGTLRMAQLQAESCKATWANFGELQTRIIEND